MLGKLTSLATSRISPTSMATRMFLLIPICTTVPIKSRLAVQGVLGEPNGPSSWLTYGRVGGGLWVSAHAAIPCDNVSRFCIRVL